MRYDELYKWGRKQLLEAGIEEAELDARLLLEEVCKTDRNYLLSHGDNQTEERQQKAYKEFIERRKKHMPLQYITGYQEFMGLRFQVTPDVLIPRQDTEILVEEAMRYLHDGMHILDMCTGSGCILISLLKYSNDCEGTGCDISEAALLKAAENAVRLGVEAAWIQGNLFENVKGKFEIIVSNPPYIPSAVIPELMEEVRDFEPAGALDGQEDGLYFYRRIVEEAPEHLHPGGMLFFEIGCEQGAAVSTYLKAAGFQKVEICKDLAGLDRVVSGIYGG